MATEQQTTPPSAGQIIKQRLTDEKFMHGFSAMLKTEAEARKEIAFAIEAIAGNQKLQECSTESILASVYKVATTGLSLNPILKFAALVPRWSQSGMICQLMPMYQGLVKLLTDTGSVINIVTNIVYEGDEFEVELGLNQKVVHRPKFKTKNLEYVYAIAQLHNETQMVEVMTKADIDYIRGCSETYRAFEAGKIKSENVIWIKWYDEMARKTCLRRLIKYVPKSRQYEELAAAMEEDEADFPATASAIGYAESLLATSTYDAEQRELIEAKLSDATKGEISNIISDLKENQNQKFKK